MEHLKPLIEACLACATACDHCASSCLKEEDPGHMRQCIALDMDCAAICILTARLIARNSPYAEQMSNLCAEVCDACATECENHPEEHCKKCADACRNCERMINELVAR